jgi:cyclase
MEELAPNVYVETDYALVTVGAVLTGAGWLCIDTPPYPRDARHWLARLKATSPQPVLYIVNTDHHRDRVLGNSHFDAPVVAHQAAAECILGLKNSFISQAAEEMSANDNELVEIASLKLHPPQISYSDTLYLQCGEREIMLVSRPSATAGSTWVMLPEEKIAFVGDSVIVGQHPYIDGGMTKLWLKTLTDLRRERFASWKFVTGRGPVTDASKTEPLSEYLRVARRRVSSLHYAGRMRSEIGMLIPEMLSYFPYDQDRREEVQRRIKMGLEAIYEELRGKEDGGEDEGEE